MATFAIENIVTALRELTQFFSECEVEYKFSSFGKTYVDGRTSWALKTLQAASVVDTPTPASNPKQRKDDKSADTADLARISASFAQTLPCLLGVLSVERALAKRVFLPTMQSDGSETNEDFEIHFDSIFKNVGAHFAASGDAFLAALRRGSVPQDEIFMLLDIVGTFMKLMPRFEKIALVCHFVLAVSIYVIVAICRAS